jgi:hypothetical protein
VVVYVLGGVACAALGALTERIMVVGCDTPSAFLIVHVHAFHKNCVILFTLSTACPDVCIMHIRTALVHVSTLAVVLYCWCRLC